MIKMLTMSSQLKT